MHVSLYGKALEGREGVDLNMFLVMQIKAFKWYLSLVLVVLW